VKVVTLYSKADCHLCDDARTALERVRREVPFDLEELDIEADEALLRAYFERIPVVAVDGRELFAYFVDEALLRSAVAESPRRGDELESSR
jgi:glutaredoxin